MNTKSKDFAAFIEKLISGATYERRSDAGIDELAETLAKIATSFDTFKSDNEHTVAQLRSNVERMETRLARPGAFQTSTLEGNEIRQLKTVDGKSLPLLSSKQKVADLNRTDDSDGFTLGGYVRDAIVGSRKSVSGPALVPTSLGSKIIDMVRRKTVLIDAGTSTILIDGPTNLARLTQDPTVYQHTEGADDIVESDILAEAVSLNPKTLAVLIPLSAELVSDSPNLDNLLNISLSAAFAGKLDTLGIATLLANANIPKSGVTQDPAVWLKVLEAVGASLALDHDLPGVHISAPVDFIARASQLASTAGTWLGKPPALQDMRELQTTGLSAGTALFGDFAEGFAFAMRQQLNVEVVRFAKATKYTHYLLAHMRADGVVLQPTRLFKQLKTVA